MSYTYQCTKAEYVRTDADNKPWYRAVIVTDNPAPDLGDIDPANVKGLADDCGLAAGSVVLYPDGKYLIAYADVNGEAPEPQEDETMKVNLAYDSTAKTLKMDKTAAEIAAAINEGKIVTAVCNDPTFLASWTTVEGVNGTMSAHVTTVTGDGEGTEVDAITADGSDLAKVKQLNFLQEPGEGKYPVCQMQA